jgi:hypothetical protein
MLFVMAPVLTSSVAVTSAMVAVIAATARKLKWLSSAVPVPLVKRISKLRLLTTEYKNGCLHNPGTYLEGD